jgi:hypothetical protein
MSDAVTAAVVALEEHGYCVLPDHFDPAVATGLRELTDRLFAETGPELSDRMPFLNRDQPMVYNLQSKDRRYLDLLFGVPVVQEVLQHFLDDEWFRTIPTGDPNYILRSYLARSSAHRMPIHIDSFVPYGGSHVFVMQAAFILEDQDEANGCTVVVPGSHRLERWAEQDYEAAVPIPSKAGDVVMWDSRVHHGALENTSGRTRWSLVATFQRWWLKQAFDIPANLPQHVYETLTESQKAILGFCSVPYDTEFDGIDMKRGYGHLPERVDDQRRGR